MKTTIENAKKTFRGISIGEHSNTRGEPPKCRTGEPVPPSSAIRFLNPTCKNPSSAAWLGKNTAHDANQEKTAHEEIHVKAAPDKKVQAEDARDVAGKLGIGFRAAKTMIHRRNQYRLAGRMDELTDSAVVILDSM